MSMAQPRVRVAGSWAVTVARAGTALIDVCAFWLSATTLTDLAVRAGIDPRQAWMWPVIVDGMIVVATVAIVALARHGARATVYPWVLLTAGALVSVTANCLHALVATDTTLPPFVAASVAAVPPLVLLAATHLTVQLGRRLAPASSAPTGPHAAVPLPADRPAGTDIDHAEPSAPPLRSPKPAGPPGNSEQASALPASTPVPVPPPPRTGLAGDGDASSKAKAEAPQQVPGGGDVREQAAVWSANGVSNREIAARLGVHPSTVGRWLTSTPAARTPLPLNGQEQSDRTPAAEHPQPE